MRPDIYYIVYHWMVQNMKLRGAELLVLATLYERWKVYSGRPTEGTTFRTYQQLEEITGYSPRQVKRAVSALMKRGLLKRSVVKKYRSKLYEFRIDINNVRKYY